MNVQNLVTWELKIEREAPVPAIPTNEKGHSAGEAAYRVKLELEIAEAQQAEAEAEAEEKRESLAMPHTVLQVTPDSITRSVARSMGKFW